MQFLKFWKWAIWKWIAENWERVAFSIVGALLIGWCLHLIYEGNVTHAAAVFGLGFLSFIYANVSRFKKFKGLGFEAELWEDKKKEAEGLIARMQNILSLYTREILFAKVLANRLTGSDWKVRWDLFEEFKRELTTLVGQADLSTERKLIEHYFFYDMTEAPRRALSKAIGAARNVAQNKIHAEFGSPIKDVQGYSRRLEQHRAIKQSVGDEFELMKTDNVPGRLINMYEESKVRLKRDFDVELNVDPAVLERLSKLKDLYDKRPLEITPELIAWADEYEMK